MNRLEAWLLHISNITVIATGLLYAYMHYLMKPADPFSVVNHPWEPYMLKMHIVGAPFLIVGIGLIVHSHILFKLNNGARSGRKTGIGLIPIFVIMALSGYFLQTFSDPFVHKAMVITHLSSGAIWFLFYIIHQLSAIKVKRTMTNGAALRRTLQNNA